MKEQLDMFFVALAETSGCDDDGECYGDTSCNCDCHGEGCYCITD